MSTSTSKKLMDEEAALLLRDSAALDVDLVDALVEREPLPEEMAQDEESRCKYLSKKCLFKRAIKAKGDLHKLCTFHRAKAIINQRRLEARKRERQQQKEQTDDSSDSSETVPPPRRTGTKRMPKKTTRETVMLPAIDVSGDVTVDYSPRSKMARVAKNVDIKLSPRDVHEIEPYSTPVMLFPEDLEAVKGLADLEITDVEPLGWEFAV